MTTHETELKTLMLASQRGDAAAYRTLLAKLTPQLRAYYKRWMMGAGRGAEEAEDLVQETLLAVHLKRHTPTIPMRCSRPGFMQARATS